MDIRQQRGLQIAKTSRIRKNENGWSVPSQSGRGTYLVQLEGHNPICTCPDHELRGCKCKHIYAVEYIIKKEIDMEGNITVTQQVKTYAQDWKAYTTAQCREQELFMELLSDLCKNIQNPEYKFGRPKLPLSDMVFASCLKVYSGFSLRRFTSYMKIAKEKGYTDTVCSYVSISNIMRDKKITSTLHKLIGLSSLPLKSVETDFAVDSSGFSTSRFARYYSFRHGREKKYKSWIKAHVISGVKSNIITGVDLSGGFEVDSIHFRPLVERTAQNFKVEEVSGDKAYLTVKNLELVDSLGGQAYIPFKKDSVARARSPRIWKKMYHYFMYNHEEFLKHYHKRSNSETVFYMIKTKFGSHVRSKDLTAQFNEVLLKILCHNVCCVIQEMHEIGIKPDFYDL